MFLFDLILLFLCILSFPNSFTYFINLRLKAILTIISLFHLLLYQLFLLMVFLRKSIYLIFIGFYFSIRITWYYDFTDLIHLYLLSLLFELLILLSMLILLLLIIDQLLSHYKWLRCISTISWIHFWMKCELLTLLILIILYQLLLIKFLLIFILNESLNHISIFAVLMKYVLTLLIYSRLELTSLFFLLLLFSYHLINLFLFLLYYLIHSFMNWLLITLLSFKKYLFSWLFHLFIHLCQILLSEFIFIEHPLFIFLIKSMFIILLPIWIHLHNLFAHLIDFWLECAFLQSIFQLLIELLLSLQFYLLFSL